MLSLKKRRIGKRGRWKDSRDCNEKRLFFIFCAFPLSLLLSLPILHSSISLIHQNDITANSNLCPNVHLSYLWPYLSSLIRQFYTFCHSDCHTHHYSDRQNSHFNRQLLPINLFAWNFVEFLLGEALWDLDKGKLVCFPFGAIAVLSGGRKG